MRTQDDAELWALAAGGILTEFNQDYFDQLASKHGPRGSREVLAGSWGTTDRAALLQQIRWLHHEGHRARVRTYFDEAEYLLGRGEIALGDPPTRFVAENLIALRKFELFSWDYSRLINVARWGFTANYLSEEEAWDYIKSAAYLIRTQFSSWAEMGEDFMLGFAFWAILIDAEFTIEDVRQRLLSDPDSPWRRIPWDLPPDLLQSAGWKNL